MMTNVTSRARRSLVVVAAIGAIPLLQASPAFAHEFTLVLVEADAGAAADAGRGFRLAVQQSPDVSHAPGQEAGDHLGGVDVDIVSVDARLPSVTEEVSGLLDSGASAVVVLAGGPDVQGVTAAAMARKKPVFAIDAENSTWPRPGQISLRSRGQADERRFADFAAAFTTASGPAPTDAATLGYDAGRLVDAVVLELGEHLEPGPALSEAATTAAEQLVLAAIDVGADTAATGGTGSDAQPATGPASAVLTTAAAASGVVVVGAWMVALLRRRRRLGI